MALIDQALARQQPQPPTQTAGASQPGGQGASLTPQKLQEMRAALEAKIPQEQREAFDRVVLAGRKVMYAEQTRDMVMKELEKEGPIDQRLGFAIAGLMALLDQESRKTIPQEVVLPAALALMLEAADLLLQIGETLSQQQLRDAIDVMQVTILRQHGANDDQIMQSFGAGGAPQAGAAPQAQGAMA
ncbi:MAG TPA: hypothetical protein VFS42_06860 [Burkholderiaceae bacterium]|nr:hypothetical protein [Burkholderiaceae bacterium]